MKKGLVSSVLCLVCLGANALELSAGGYITALDPDRPCAIEADKEPFFRLRGKQVLTLSPDKDGRISVSVTNSQVGRYQYPTEYTLTDTKGKVLAKGEILLKKSARIEVLNQPEGLYKLSINSLQNAAIVKEPSGLCFIEGTKDHALKMIEHCPKLFFLTKSLGPNTTLKMNIAGSPTEEHIALTIWDADGKVVLQDNSVGKTNNLIPVSIPVPKAQQGRLWALKIDRVPDKGYEDMAIVTVDGAESVFSFEPSKLAVPPVQREAFIDANGDTFMGIRINSKLAGNEGLKAIVTFDSLDKRDHEHLSSTWTGNSDTFLVGMTFPAQAIKYGKLKYTFFDASGKDVLKEESNVVAYNGEIYHEILWHEDGQQAKPSQADLQRKYQIFQRQEPGFVRPEAVFREDEVITELNAQACPGLVSNEYFVIYPLTSFQSAKVDMGSLTGDNGTSIPRKNIEILTIRIWSQKTDWNAKTFIVAPELLDKLETVDLFERHPQQYAIQVKVPEGTKPGKYTGTITMDGKPCLPYTLHVSSFKLPEVKEMTFGLYSDSGRWKKYGYSDDGIRNELKLFRDYGMTALMLSPESTETWDGSKLTVDFTNFRKTMKLYKEAGFEGVIVMSLQSINPKLRKAIGQKKPGYTPAFVKAYHDYLDEFRRVGKEDGWPEYCIHTVDEPGGGETGEEAIRSLRLVKQAGFKTFNTCYGSFVRKYLDPWLDYRCYNNVGYFSMPKEKDADDLRAETLAAGDSFWWYGSGCYTNYGFMQDCNEYSNRHMLGLMNFRIKATGAWSWTFMRPKKSPYNDFDGSGYSEEKDACTAYPTPDKKGVISTLQWEAIRQGVYDYRYLCLWQNLVNAAKGNPAKAAAAAESEKLVNKAISDISWTAREFAIKNDELRSLRSLLVAEIEKLCK